MLVIVQTNDLGSALLNFGIFLAMLYVATGRALFVAAGLALFVGGAAVLYNAHRPRPGSRHDLAAAVDGRARLLRAQRRARAPPGLRLVPARQEPLLDRERRLRRHGARSGHVHVGRRHAAHPVPPHRLHLLGDRAGARARSAPRRCSSSSCSSSSAGCASRSRRRTASRSSLAAGLTFGFALQTFIIVGGVLRVVPLTGITLPFVSYGGTSIVANFVLLALLLLVSNRANTPR